MAVKVQIEKIELSGFSMIKNPESVDLDANFNLVYGDEGANDMKASILLAIEFMLSGSYAPKHVAMTCLHPGVATEDHQAYVTLYLSSAEKFKLNGKERQKFTVTRYLHHEDAGNVYYGSRQCFNDMQPIRSFHLNLRDNLLTWMADPLTSQRVRPTNIEINRMLIHSLGFSDMLKDGNVRERHDLYLTKNGLMKRLMTLLKKETDKQRTFLRKQNSLELAILNKKIANLRTQNPNALNYGDMLNNYDTYMLFEYVDELENNQFDAINQMHENFCEISFATDPIDLSELQDVLNEFPAALEKYTKELEVDCKEQWKHEENNQLVAMRANLSQYFVGGADVSAEAKSTCQNAISTVQRQLRTMLQTVEQKRKIETQMQSNFVEIVASMRKSMKSRDDVAKKYLNAMSIRLELKKQLFECTNLLDLGELLIKKFCVNQKVIHSILIDAWRKGLSTLTDQIAYEKKIAPKFKGNAFDFIEIPEDDDDLAYVAAMIPYFATFFFDTPAKAQEFEELISEEHSDVYVCSINQSNEPNRISGLPFTSLADILLSKETCRSNPLVKKWFDQFRVITDDLDAEQLQQKAKQMECRILFENRCYCKDGSVRETFQEITTDEWKEFLTEWKNCLKGRDEKIKDQPTKYAGMKSMDQRTETLAKLQAQESEHRFQISKSLATISSLIGKMIDLAHLSIEVIDLQSSRTVRLNVLLEQMRYFENGISNLDIGELTVRQIADCELKKRIIDDAIEKFTNFAEKIGNNLDGGKMPNRLSNEMAKYQGVIEMTPNQMDFKKEIVGLSKPQMTHWHEYVRSKVLFQMEWELMYNRGLIQMHPEFIDQSLVERYERDELDQLKLLRADLITPDFDALNKCCAFIEKNRMLMANIEPIINLLIEPELIHATAIYFDRLINALRILNEMVVVLPVDIMIGIELTTTDEQVDIFPDTLAQRWYQQFPLRKLCECDTELRFITKTDRSSDILNVNSHRYAVLFHLAVSLVMTTLIVLNNSIIGMPSDELKVLITWLMYHYKIDEHNERNEEDNKQIIVVQRSDNNTLPTDGFHLIHCVDE